MNSAPIFVKIDKHKEVMQTLEDVKAKIREAKDALKKIQELKTAEDREIEQWNSELSKADEKIDFVHDALTREG